MILEFPSIRMNRREVLARHLNHSHTSQLVGRNSAKERDVQTAAGFRGEILEITDRRGVGGRRVCQQAAFGKDKRRGRRNDPDGIKKL